MATKFEDIFVCFLGTPKRLVEYIETNIDLSAYINSHYSAYVKAARLILPNYPALVKEGKTMDWIKIIEILFRRRPELWRVVITHPNGLKWLQSQKFKDFLQ